MLRRIFISLGFTILSFPVGFIILLLGVFLSGVYNLSAGLLADIIGISLTSLMYIVSPGFALWTNFPDFFVFPLQITIQFIYIWIVVEIFNFVVNKRKNK